mmetsp:Transcript_42606/g.138621  ORF Transcript_42606/g.138621 Transcript_42606/m.138621 type:complete len:204 (+) Transcript_42606:22-633(+)
MKPPPPFPVFCLSCKPAAAHKACAKAVHDVVGRRARASPNGGSRAATGLPLPAPAALRRADVELHLGEGGLRHLSDEHDGADGGEGAREEQRGRERELAAEGLLAESPGGDVGCLRGQRAEEGGEAERAVRDGGEAEEVVGEGEGHDGAQADESAEEERGARPLRRDLDVDRRSLGREPVEAVSGAACDSTPKCTAHDCSERE